MKETITIPSVENVQFGEKFKDFRRREKTLFDNAKGAGKSLMIAFMMISSGVGNSGRHKRMEYMERSKHDYARQQK